MGTQKNGHTLPLSKVRACQYKDQCTARLAAVQQEILFDYIPYRLTNKNTIEHYLFPGLKTSRWCLKTCH